MRSAQVSLMIAMTVLPGFAAAPTYRVTGTDAIPWSRIFESVGIAKSGKGDPVVVVAGGKEQIDVGKLAERHILVLEGNSAASRSVGFVPKTQTVDVRRICDVHAPKMNIIWEQRVRVPAVDVPSGFEVFATEKWKGIPVVAGKRTAHGAILWIATPPGVTGIERYPYIIQALVDLGLELPVRTSNLWAFFDSSYRIRADLDYLARRWRQAGISVLHVAAWHNVEPDPAQDEF
ncbi:MAG: hypothetical protein ACJ74Z_08590 [Bryobacteraceae bacterium]